MPNCTLKICLIFVAVLLTGCSTKYYVRQVVDGLIDHHGAGKVIGIMVEERDGQQFVLNYGRISGDRQWVELDDLSVVYRFEQPGFIYLVYAPEENAQQVQALLFDSEGISYSETAIRYLRKYADTFPAIQGYKFRLHSVMSPRHSGLSLEFEAPVTDTLEMMTLLSYEQGNVYPSAYWWSRLTELTLHELLHLNYDLDPSDHKRMNEEAAANLLEACMKSDYAIASDISRLFINIDMSSEYSLREFPGIQENRFFPNVSELEKMPHPSMAGSAIYAAILFLEIGMRERFPFNEPDTLENLKTACLEFGTKIPDFASGERPWRD